jgi:HEAT repeat protein
MGFIKDLEKQYTSLKQLDEITQITATFEFNEELLKDNSEEMLEFHYSLLKDLPNDMEHYKLRNRIRAAFKERPKEKIEPFLLAKLNSEPNLSLKTDIILLLGLIRSAKVLPYIKANMKSDNGNIREICAVVLGWIGNKEDLPLLNERLLNETNDELRGSAATSMRQMWFKDKAAAEDILPYLYSAIIKEDSEDALRSIIITIQSLLKRKFGLQEKLNDRTITGDVFKAKEKIIKQLKL